MVRKINNRKRFAFTMIELIFAIVIIAVSVISLPMMTQTTSRGIDANILQEAIFAAATELNEAVTAHWDENSIEPGMLDSTARVIDDGSCLDSVAAFRQMTGHINQPLHRRCLDSNATGVSNSSTNDNVNALDDMEHTAANESIFINPNPDQAGYKETYTSTLELTHPANFDGTGNSNNIKMITSTISNSDGTIALLRTYSANIGEVDYYKRSY